MPLSIGAKPGLFIYLENLFVLERFDSRSEGKEYFCDTYSPSAVL